MAEKIRGRRYLLAILFLGSGLMAYGIWVRAPHVMGPDEKTAVTKALWLGVHWTPFIPDFNKGGNLYLYVLALSFGPLYLYFKLTGRTEILTEQASSTTTFFDASPELKNAFYDFLLAGRVESVIIGVMTVVFVYILARALYNKRAGLIAALALSVSMAFVNAAHYATEDILLTALIALVFVLFTKHYTTQDDRYLFGASLAAGLAVSAKATAGFLAIPLVYLILKNRLGQTVKLERETIVPAGFDLMTHGSVSLAAYLLTTPSIFVYPGLYVSDIFGESTRGFASNPHTIFPSWLLQLTNIVQAVGLPLFLLSIGGLALVAYRLYSNQGNRIEVAMFLFLVPYFGLILLRAHVWFVIPVVPFLAVFVGRFADFLVRNPRQGERWTILLITGVMVFSLVYTGFTVQGIANDARVDSSKWIAQNVDPGATIDVYQYALHLPEFPSGVNVHNYWFNSTAEEDWRQATERVDCRRPDYIVLSSAHYAFFVRNPAVSPKISEFYDKLLTGNNGYETVKVFGPPIRDMDSPDDLIRSTVVPRTITNHDLRIIILKRKGSVGEGC